MRVAIVHDWLLGMRGGERALDIFCKIFPDSEIFTLFYNKSALTPAIEDRPIHTSFLQNLPFARKSYRNYLPLFPLAVESFNLDGFDLIISSSHCVAKGAKKPAGAYHFCYCYTPMRYVWVFFEQYFGSYSPIKKCFVKMVTENLKRWDLSTLDRVDDFVAISETIKIRIKDVYDRDSTVIYPPVDIDKFRFEPSQKKSEYYLCVSALVPYKRIDIIIDAFNIMKDKKILVVGDGHLGNDLKLRKKSDNIMFTGRVTDDELRTIYENAKAFVFAAEEDFGIAPVEAQAMGVSVIAYGKGGTSETVIPMNAPREKMGQSPSAFAKASADKSGTVPIFSGAGKNPTGILFYEQTAEALIRAVNEFEKREDEFNPVDCRRNAERFSEDKFVRNMKDFVNKKTGGKATL